MTEPKRMIPPGVEQAWEKLRRDVANRNSMDEQGNMGGDQHEMDRRVSKLETRLATIEERMVVKLEALALSYGVMANALDKLVTRTEFDSIRALVYVLCGSVVIGAVAIVVVKTIHP